MFILYKLDHGALRTGDSLFAANCSAIGWASTFLQYDLISLKELFSVNEVKLDFFACDLDDADLVF